MTKYIKKLIGTKEFMKEGKITTKESIIMISRKDKKWMKAEELKSYYNSLMNDANKDNIKLGVIIRLLAGTRWFTVKGKTTDLNIKTIDEYFEGRVRDEKKFATFSQIEVTVLKPVKQKDDGKKKVNIDKDEKDKKKKVNIDKDEKDEDEEDEEDEVIQKTKNKLKKSK
jgi:hypothetical protein